MQKITPFLWFDHQAEDAVNFYTSIFKNSKILSINRYGENGPGKKEIRGPVIACLFPHYNKGGLGGFKSVINYGNLNY